MIFTAFLLYRSFADETFGANAQISLEMTVAAFVLSLIWFYAARAYRIRRGVAVDKRFQEIPVE